MQCNGANMAGTLNSCKFVYCFVFENVNNLSVVRKLLMERRFVLFHIPWDFSLNHC